jgi:hypothetical protein
MIRRITSLGLLLTSAACASLAGLAVSELIDQPWNEVREPIFSARTYLTIFSSLTALCASAAIALFVMFVRQMRATEK